MTKRVLLVGTNNSKKRREILDLLNIEPLEIKLLSDFPKVDEVVEDGDSFRANAEKKAAGYARAHGCWTLGEDSGLAVDALGGAPGIFSARWSGAQGDDEKNNDKLLAELEGIEHARRTAHYVCAAVIADPAGNIKAHAIGRCDGHITTERRGTGGFGYDPLFWIEEAGKTFGELPIEYKHSRSHRAAALRALRPQILALIESGEWKGMDTQ